MRSENRERTLKNSNAESGRPHTANTHYDTRVTTYKRMSTTAPSARLHQSPRRDAAMDAINAEF